MSGPLVALEGIEHCFGKGALRAKILHGVTAELRAGEIVILTGPSGSGKTTLLTLIGALRRAQRGSLRVFGRELVAASRRSLPGVRRQIGYIFQHHNLLGALTASQNVQLSLALHGRRPRCESRGRAVDLLDAVGLAGCADRYPNQLSGGQKQRVAVARALAARPRLVLADEPTASLDKKSGREVVALMQQLAREQGVALLLVTHDHRILDIADRILHLEDGRLSPFGEAAISQTRQTTALLAQAKRRGELTRQVAGLDPDGFQDLLEQVRCEALYFLRISELSRNDTFASMVEQVLEAFTLKIGDTLGADRATLFLVDETRGELWSKVAGGASREIRIPRTRGIAGAVVTTGRPLNVRDADVEPRFYASVDRVSGYRTHSVLCAPLRDRAGRILGVAQLLNKRGGNGFDARDEHLLRGFAGSLGVILESWWPLCEARRRSRVRGPAGAPSRLDGGPSRPVSALSGFVVQLRRAVEARLHMPS